MHYTHYSNKYYIQKNKGNNLIARRKNSKNNIILKTSQNFSMHQSLSVVLEESSFKEANSTVKNKSHNNSIDKENSYFNKDENVLLETGDNFNNGNDLINKFENIDFHGGLNSKKHFRSCKFCLILKPNRTHHCRKCRKCVRHSDHHCYFINNCVGIENYKLFLLLTLYSLILLTFICISMFSSLNFIYLEFGLDSIEFLFISSTIVICFILDICLGFLLVLHIRLILRGMTTLEYLEKSKRILRERISKNTIKIDNYISGTDEKSFFDKMKIIFGESMWVWLIPIIDKRVKECGYTDQ